jgi:putative transposase
MGLARSTYYYRSCRHESEEATLVKSIEAVCERWPAYGYRRVMHQLRHEGLFVNHKRIARLMRLHGLQACAPRRFVATSDGGALAPYPNRVVDLRLDRPDQLWVADLTYVGIRGGFVYLAAILDAFSRRVIGYAIASHMGVQLTLAALTAAIRLRQPRPGCIHHSDRGTQYGALLYRQTLERHGLLGSMSRRGNPYDNAKAESFIKTLKYEGIHPRAYRSFAELQQGLPRFIEDHYNAERLHSALGYLSPLEFEDHHARTPA